MIYIEFELPNMDIFSFQTTQNLEEGVQLVSSAPGEE